jgi:hypothetical protein
MTVSGYAYTNKTEVLGLEEARVLCCQIKNQEIKISSYEGLWINYKFTSSSGNSFNKPM